MLGLLLVVLLAAPACEAPKDPSGPRRRSATTSADAPSNAVSWGCGQAIPSTVKTLDPSWREGAIVVGDLGFDVPASGWSGYRPHEDAAIQVKLPIMIQGHVAVTVSVPETERGLALILSDVPRSGPGNSYRIEDGHQAVRFQPCADRSWSAWTAGLALAKPRSVVVNVHAADATQSTPVTLGPFEVS